MGERRLGEVLEAEGRISREQAEWAAGVAARNGARIGSVLVAAGLVRRAERYRVLAGMCDCPFVDWPTRPSTTLCCTASTRTSSPRRAGPRPP